MSRRLSAWLLASLAIHAGLVAGVQALVGVIAPPMLFVDLVHGVFAGDESALGRRARAGDGASVKAPAGPSARPASRSAVPARAAKAVPSVDPRREAAIRAPQTPAPPEPVMPPAEPVRPQPEPVQPAPQPVQSAPEPVLTVVEPARPTPPSPAPPSGTVDSAPPSALPGGPASRGTGTSSPPVGRPGGSGRSESPGTGGGSVRTEHGSGAGGGAGFGVGAREGSALALVVPGDGSGEGAEYGAYLALVRSRIHALLRYPPVARHRGLSGTVLIDVEIAPTGEIGRVSVAASSSHRVLDEAAVDAVRGLRRVPFPPNLRPRALRTRLPVVFDLRPR